MLRIGQELSKLWGPTQSSSLMSRRSAADSCSVRTAVPSVRTHLGKRSSKLTAQSLRRRRTVENHEQTQLRQPPGCLLPCKQTTRSSDSAVIGDRVMPGGSSATTLNPSTSKHSDSCFALHQTPRVSATRFASSRRDKKDWGRRNHDTHGRWGRLRNTDDAPRFAAAS